jgi:hypothetical protein
MQAVVVVAHKLVVQIIQEVLAAEDKENQQM